MVTPQLEKGVDLVGETIINGYTILEEIGRGSYGKVKLAVNDAGEVRAMKILRKSLMKRVETGDLLGLQVAQMEVAVMKKLRHKNIVRLFEVIDDPKQDKVYFVMQYVDNGPLLRFDDAHHCKPLSPATIRLVMRQLTSALLYLHRHGVVHRDIKPDNILVDTAGTVFLSDFGVSDLVHRDEHASMRPMLPILPKTHQPGKGTPAFFCTGAA
jgi:serine/threonine protein kinase